MLQLKCHQKQYSLFNWLMYHFDTLDQGNSNAYPTVANVTLLHGNKIYSYEICIPQTWKDSLG